MRCRYDYLKPASVKGNFDKCINFMLKKVNVSCIMAICECLGI